MELLIRAGVAGFPHPLCIARVWALCHYVNVFQGSCSEVIDSVTNSDSSLAKMLRLAFSPICKLVLSLRNLPKKSIQHFPVCMKEPTACDFCSGWWEARLAPACSLSQHLKNKKPANQLLHLVITDHDRPRGKTTSCTLNWERHHGWRSSGSGRSRSCEAPGMSCADAPFRGGSDANSGPGGSGQGSQGTLPAHPTNFQTHCPNPKKNKNSQARQSFGSPGPDRSWVQAGPTFCIQLTDGDHGQSNLDVLPAESATQGCSRPFRPQERQLVSI